ncbi:MAG: HAD family hydrolase [Alphaproteobacteria bacterium]|jgi:phosphoglycolate phosphatase|nr:HAD family hydrolase [Alphaproteobacteria bacterium]
MAYNLKKPQAILFDWDNTLVSTWEILHRVINLTLAEYKMPLWTLEKVKSTAHKSSREAFPTLFGDKWEEAREFFYKNFNKFHLEELKTMPDALPLLDFLAKQNIKLGVVSNKKTSILNKEIEFLNWSGFFNTVIGAGDAEKDKPAPDPIFLALDRIGLKASEEIWFVGDTIVDWQAARASGCQPIALGENCENELLVPNISNCENLLLILLQLYEIAD